MTFENWRECLPALQSSQWVGFFMALCVSLFLTPLIRERAIKLNLLSSGGGRHLHTTPIPRLGGIAIYLSCLITSIFFTILYGRYTPSGFEHFELLGILIGATLIFIVGFLDDLSPLPALWKLLAQVLAAVVAWFCNVKVTYLANPLFYLHLAEARIWELPLWLSFAITIIWLVPITNALNLIDGLDGLAGGVSLITALSLWAIFMDDKINQPAGALLVATIAGGVLGFLRLNYNPARIFLGDAGAYFLGFTLGATSVAGLSGNPNTAAVGSVVVLVFSFPLADTIFAIFRRLWQRKPLMEPDAEHIHHRILKAGISAKKTMFIIYGTCILLGLVVSILSGAYKRYLVLLLFTLSVALLNFLWRREKLEEHPGDKNTAPKSS